MASTKVQFTYRLYKDSYDYGKVRVRKFNKGKAPQPRPPFDVYHEGKSYPCLGCGERLLPGEECWISSSGAGQLHFKCGEAVDG